MKSAHLDESVSELKRSLRGEVLVRADAEYDAARRCFNALVDRRPAVIARCAAPADVAAAFDFARAARAGGRPCAEAGTTRPGTASARAGS